MTSALDRDLPATGDQQDEPLREKNLIDWTKYLDDIGEYNGGHGFADSHDDEFGTNEELWYVQVESDYQTLVKALQSSELDKAPEGILFREIRVFARQNFNACSFSFAPRACNDLAHTVAAFGATLQVSSEIWPDDLSNVVLVHLTSNLDQIDQKQRETEAMR
ncbi:hypothetical protein D1007_23677 [Hordeum vulgare]|nr:hypothetical protein D1007_23677 [Hordeum vulgare]